MKKRTRTLWSKGGQQLNKKWKKQIFVFYDIANGLICSASRLTTARSCWTSPQTSKICSVHKCRLIVSDILYCTFKDTQSEWFAMLRSGDEDHTTYLRVNRISNSNSSREKIRQKMQRKLNIMLYEIDEHKHKSGQLSVS